MKQRRTRLSFVRLERSGIPLEEILAAHRFFRSPSALAGSIGDGFLYAENPLFRRVRDEYLRAGFGFTTENVCDYFAYPLMALDELIAAGRVPYRENAVWLEKLARSAPGRFPLPVLKRCEVQYNYLFHESAHLLAHRAFFGRTPLARAPKSDATFLRVIVGEAFANAAECLAAAFVEGEIAQYFYEANCHFRASETEAGILRRSVRSEGAAPTLRVLVGAFLYGNFLFETLGAAREGRLRRWAGWRAGRPINRIARVGLALNEEFRTLTTPLHLLKSGFTKAPRELFRGDPVTRLLADRRLALALGGLIDRVAGGLEAECPAPTPH